MIEHYRVIAERGKSPGVNIYEVLVRYKGRDIGHSQIPPVVQLEIDEAKRAVRQTMQRDSNCRIRRLETKVSLQI